MTSLPPLALRFIGGALVVVVSVGFGWLGGLWFTGFVALVVVLAGVEMWRLLVRAGHAASIAILLASAGAAFVGIRFAEFIESSFAISLVLLASLALQLRRWRSRTVADWAVSYGSGFYLGWTGGHLALLREGEEGLTWLLFTLCTIWFVDSAAFAAGNLFGRHRLAPNISPGKTWEGYIGGLFAGVAVGSTFGMFTPVGGWVGALCGTLVGALSVLGDLIESMIKRLAHAKDSGHLIPGHGGVWDRVDSLLWAGVIVFYARSFIGSG